MKPVQTIVKLGNTTLVHGTIELAVPVGGGRFRQAIILMPVAFKTPPTVTVSLYNENVGPAFGLSAIDKLPQTGLYEVKISAINVIDNTARPETFFCDYIIVGETA